MADELDQDSLAAEWAAALEETTPEPVASNLLLPWHQTRATWPMNGLLPWLPTNKRQ